MTPGPAAQTGARPAQDRRPSARTTGPQWAALALILTLAVVLVAVVLLRDDAPTGTPEDAPASGAPQTAEAGGDPSDGGDAPTDGPASEVLGPQEPEVADLARREEGDPLAVGPVDAPVVLVAYSDYQCPFCAVWVEQTGPTMLEYVEAGDLRIEWRDVNVFGPDSERAALAVYAAGLQGAFLEMHHALFEGGESRTPRELSEEALVAVAADLGLDTERLRTDMNSPETLEAIRRNADEGAAVGAFSTPSFLVGEQPVVGAQPTEVFVRAVEDALAREG